MPNNAQLVKKMVDRAYERRMFSSMRPKVGEVIKSLTEEEREQCKTLTAKDFNCWLEKYHDGSTYWRNSHE